VLRLRFLIRGTQTNVRLTQSQVTASQRRGEDRFERCKARITCGDIRRWTRGAAPGRGRTPVLLSCLEDWVGVQESEK